MDSYQISKILKKSRITQKCFKGVYSSNTIPPVKNFVQYPYGFVVNTDKAGKPGTHWVAFYIPNSQTAEYFDSLGIPPHGDILNFLSAYKNVLINSKKLQSSWEISCGPHVIYFITRKCMGHSFKSIINSLSTNHAYSDFYVKMFLIKLLNYE